MSFEFFLLFELSISLVHCLIDDCNNILSVFMLTCLYLQSQWHLRVNCLISHFRVIPNQSMLLLFEPSIFILLEGSKKLGWEEFDKCKSYVFLCFKIMHLSMCFKLILREKYPNSSNCKFLGEFIDF
jgi:hypothetical protein